MKKLIVLVLAVILVLAGVRLVKMRKAKQLAIPAEKVLPVVVDTVRLDQAMVRLTLPAMGVVATDLSATLSTKISSRVVEITKKEGDPVKKGEMMARLDASDLKAKKQGLVLKKQSIGFEISAARDNIKALESALASARETHSRTKALLEVKGASREMYRQEEASLAKIQAQLSGAVNSISVLQKNREALTQNIKEVDSLLSYAAIVSPISGTVSRRFAMVGDMTGPGKILFQVSAGSGFFINLSLPDSVTSRTLIFNNTSLVLVPKNQASSSGLAQYLASLPADSGVVEGQFVNVKVVVYEGQTSLLPMDGVLNVGGESFAYVMENDQPKRIRLNVVARGSEGLVVDQDLSGKTIVLAKPDILLRVAAGVPVITREHGQG